MKKLEFMLFSAALVLAMACTDVDDDPGQTGDAGTLLDTFKFTDAGDVCSDPTGDYDGDGISNALEGCLSGRDSDGDKVPDWQDFDSDDDKLPDADEHGEEVLGRAHEDVGRGEGVQHRRELRRVYALPPVVHILPKGLVHVACAVRAEVEPPELLVAAPVLTHSPVVEGDRRLAVLIPGVR